MRLKFTVGVALLAAALSGCGYKPLDAPCSMNEGGTPTAMERQAIQPASPQNAVQALSFAEPDQRLTPAPFRLENADCGPLRPISTGKLR
jgi:hypothetical protein